MLLHVSGYSTNASKEHMNGGKKWQLGRFFGLLVGCLVLTVSRRGFSPEFGVIFCFRSFLEQNNLAITNTQDEMIEQVSVDL